MGLAGQFVSAVRAVEGVVGMRLACGIVVKGVALGSLAVAFRGEFVLSGSFPVELMHNVFRQHDGGQILNGVVSGVAPNVLSSAVAIWGALNFKASRNPLLVSNRL